MKGIVLSLFQLILEVFFKLTLNAINKDMKVLKVLLQKGIKVKIYNRNGTFVATLILSSSDVNNATKI